MRFPGNHFCRRPLPFCAAASAFTLIELLVVIAIIALLAAFAFPAINSALNSAKSAQTISHLKQTGAILMNYASDNNNRMPNSEDTSPLAAGGAKFFQGDVSTYAGLQMNWTKNPPFDDMFYDPCLPQSVQHPWGAFGVNDSILHPGSQGVLITKIASPATKVIYCSASGGTLPFKTSWKFTGSEFVTQGISSGIYCPDPRNRGKAASLFLDGHVELLDVEGMDPASRRKYFTPDPAS